MGNRFIIFASFSALIAIGIGAFAAHALQEQLNVQQLMWIDKAWHYQVFHSVALLALGFFVSATAKSAPACRQTAANIIGLFWGLGIIGFCFGLYYLALVGEQFHWVIPVGGVCFMLGWAALLIISIRISLNKN